MSIEEQGKAASTRHDVGGTYTPAAPTKRRAYTHKLNWQEEAQANRTMESLWAVETNPKINCAASTHMAENHDGPSREIWRVFERENNAINRNRGKLEESRQ